MPFIVAPNPACHSRRQDQALGAVLANRPSRQPNQDGQLAYAFQAAAIAVTWR